MLTAQGKDIGFFMKTLRDVVAANRRLIFLDGKAIVCNHNWIRDHAHQMKGWCHWERDCLSFLQLIIDTQRADGMFYELVKQLDDGHWTMVDDTSRVLFPEDNLALARLDLEADVEYVTVEAAHLYWRMTGDDRWMASVLPKLEKAINWQTSDPRHWNAEYGLCIRPFTIDTWDFVPMTSTGPDRRIHPWEPMPAFHGDNTGVWQAMGQLAAMNERLGRADRAAAWRARADALKANIFKHPRASTTRRTSACRFPTPTRSTGASSRSGRSGRLSRNTNGDARLRGRSPNGSRSIRRTSRRSVRTRPAPT